MSPCPQDPAHPYRALATDYDGTLAERGTVMPSVLESLGRLRGRGWRLLLVTGRRLDDLQETFHGLALFDIVVGENGGLVFTPGSGETRLLGPPPAPAVAEELRRRGVRLSVGQVMMGTTRAHEAAVLQVLQQQKLNLQPIFNGDSLMLLPRGVDKESGLRAALAALGLHPASVVAVGDAENDISFMRVCGCSVAVGNALPEVREIADLTVSGSSGVGVRQLVDILLEDGGRTS